MSCNTTVRVSPVVIKAIPGVDRDVVHISNPTPVVQIGRDGVVVVPPPGGTAVQLRDKPRVVELGIPGPPGRDGPPGPAGGTAQEKTAARALSGHRVVRATGADTVDYASVDDALMADDVLGLTLGAASAGATVYVLNNASVTEPSWAWTPLEPLFLGLDGLLTQTPLESPAAAFVLPVGFAQSSDTIMVRIGTPIYY